MQVEVTKYTEGAKDKEARPNAMPVSLIKYDGMPPACLLYLSTSIQVSVSVSEVVLGAGSEGLLLA